MKSDRTKRMLPVAKVVGNSPGVLDESHVSPLEFLNEERLKPYTLKDWLLDPGGRTDQLVPKQQMHFKPRPPIDFND